MRQITPTIGHEIHEEKRHITDDVDPAQIGIEFDAVEWRPLLPPPHDVVCVQISVAFTHGPVPLAQRQQRPRFGEGATEPVIEPANGGDILGLLEAPLEHRQVIDDLVPDGGHVAQWGFRSSHRGMAMKLGNLDCERSHVAEPTPCPPRAASPDPEHGSNSRMRTAYSTADPGPPTFSCPPSRVRGSTST